MSGINSLLQPHPYADESSSLSKDIWKIWVGKQSLVSNQPQYNQPWSFIPRESEISTVSELTSELSALDDSPPRRVRYIFCRQGVTSEQLDPHNGFGYWDDQHCEGFDMSSWKNMCEDLLKLNLGLHDPYVYGVIVDHNPYGQSYCFWWMDKNELERNYSDAAYDAKYVDQL